MRLSLKLAICAALAGVASSSAAQSKSTLVKKDAVIVPIQPKPGAPVVARPELVRELSVGVVPPGLSGFVDMHTHPMSHLGFGGMIMYGAPDTRTLMLRGQKYRGFDAFKPECNDRHEPAGTVEDALSNCNAIHGGHGADNDCGDYVRAEVVNLVDKVYDRRAKNGIHNDHPHGGYPSFDAWPQWSSVTHQQMWWEWIKRAHGGGLRVMVALAVNNSLLARAANAVDYVDDKSSVELQLREIQKLVDNHRDFMEVARSAADLRRIVGAGKLAVVLGVETEDLGNLSRRAKFDKETITKDKVEAELQRLYDEFGVRYVLPIHLSDNLFGGTALNDNLFALSSKYYTNAYPQAVESCDSGIHFKLSKESFGFPQADFLRQRDLGWVIDNQPTYATPRTGCGHKNGKPFQAFGTAALEKLMKLGAIIDVDHMSELSVEATLTLAEARRYPISSGHNGLRGAACTSRADENCNENQRTRRQYERIRDLGGMVGLGHGGRATNFVRGYQQVLDIMGGRNVAIGTDVNGMFAMPAPDPDAPVVYDASFPMYSFGRAWDFNKVGFAHYGLFPDYVRSFRSSPSPEKRMTSQAMSAFMSSAEHFAQMWERSEARARELRGGASTTSVTIQPEALGGLCPSQRVAGDGDFGGHGPRVTGAVTLRIGGDGAELVADLSLAARETQSDWSEVRGTASQVVYRAPAGQRITRIESAASSSIDQTLNGGGRNEAFQGCDGDEHILRPSSGPVARILMVGDTGGGDISGDADCHCDTRVNRVEFNPVRLTLAPR